MSFLSLHSRILKELLSACEIATDAGAELRTARVSTEDSPTLRFQCNPGESEHPKFCELLFRLRQPDDAEGTVQTSTGFHWTSPHHPVTMEVTGEFREANHHLDQRIWPVLLYDLCQVIPRCSNCSGSHTLPIECDSRTARKMFYFTMSTDGIECSRGLLCSAFVFAFLIRVSGIGFMQAVASDGDKILVKFEKDCESRSVIMLTCAYRPDDEMFAEKFKAHLDFCTATDCDVYLCILFNEVDVCDWYLKVKGVEKQRHRLPNHDTTRIQLISDATCLTVQVTAFDCHRENCYYETEALTADQVMNQFRDDQFLQTVIPLCEQQSALKQSFHLECFTVPCRTTLHLMQLAFENESSQSDVQQEELRKKPSLPAGEDPSVTLLQSAANGDLAEVSRITVLNPSLLNYLSPNLPNRTALLCAASASVTDFTQGSKSHAECVQLLISKGADAQVTDSRKHSVLHCAVLSANTDLLQLLLERKVVDINSKDENRKTPLLLAVENDNIEITKMLLSSGASCDLNDTVLTTALMSGNAEIVKQLVTPDSFLLLEEESERFASYYLMAWNAGHRSVCASLIALKYSLTEDCINEAVKLSGIVCLGKSAELRQALTEANLHYRDWKLRTPLMWAAIGCWKPTDKHAECAQLLIDLGADHVAIDLDGNTSLHLAAASGNLPVVRSLVNCGASVTERNFKGATPLMMAKERGQEKVLGMLTDEADEEAELTTFEQITAKLEHMRLSWQRLVNEQQRNGSRFQGQNLQESKMMHIQRMLEMVQLAQSQMEHEQEQSADPDVSINDVESKTGDKPDSDRIVPVQSVLCEEVPNLVHETVSFDLGKTEYSIADISTAHSVCSFDGLSDMLSDMSHREYNESYSWNSSLRCCTYNTSASNR